jgi:site-specific DNA-methyltransferase (adenine-specific)
MMIDLRCGDCLELMRDMPDGSVDAVVTDPPYGIGIASNPFRQKFAKSDWDAAPATDDAIGEVLRVSRYQIIWGGNYFHLPPSQGFLVWDKAQPYAFSSAMCEQAWTNLQRPAKLFRYSVVSYEKKHPTQKPAPLMVWSILYLPDDVDTVLDPFMGSGTTGVACVQTGRNFIGFEIDPGYFEIAKRRIADAQAQPALMEATG